MLIYLNGTSSSGKTSMAVELQKLIQKPTFYFSIDTLLQSLANEDLEAIQGRKPYRQQLDWHSIFSGYFASVASLVNEGNQVIADCPVYNQKLGELFNKFIKPLSRKIIVRIDCPLNTLEERERNRGDRSLGIAKDQFKEIHSHIVNDLKIDTLKLTPAESARHIFSYIEKLV